VDFDISDLEQRLLPTLRAAGIERIQEDHFGKKLVERTAEIFRPACCPIQRRRCNFSIGCWIRGR
jgi:hypothetical protein